MDIGAGALGHAIAFVVLLVAGYFTAQFLISNEPLWLTRDANGTRLGGVFAALGLPFQWGGGSLEWRLVGWAVGSVAIMTVIGWFFLECFELYLPVTAKAALAYLSGMGICGFVFELLAMAGRLNRTGVFVSLGFILLILWFASVIAARKKPESWGGGEGGGAEQTMRRQLANERFAKCLVWPCGFFQSSFTFIAGLLIAVILLAIFYHAILFPEVYWDSLILYLGYARMMFYQHGIVRKVVGQVGIGLGANYPHLYSLLGAAASLAAREWTELPQRLITPCAAVASTVLVYHIALRLTRHVNFSLAVTLLYRSIPLVIAYDQYASDYAITILFCAGFLYLALLYIETGLSGYFILATALIAFSMHLNYLMGILCLPWGLMILAAHVWTPTMEETAEAETIEENLRYSRPSMAVTNWEEHTESDPSWTVKLFRRPLLRFLTSPTFVMTAMACGAVGSVWLIRNWMVTGNPVYAFFNGFFHGIHVNPEVMESASKEWMENGAGIGRMGETAAERLKNSWAFFVTWKQAYLLQPFVTGFVGVGILLLLARAAASPFLALRHSRHSGEVITLRYVDYGSRYGFVVLALALALFGYHYFLAPFYLYQIVMVGPALAVLACFIYPYWRLRPWRWIFGGMALLIGLVPGVAFALMGFKLHRAVPVGAGRVESKLDLFALRHPLPDADTFYEWQYGADAAMFRYINKNLKGETILTHENRHLVFDPTISLVHLDDWGIQLIWPQSAEGQAKDLKEALGIRYYLFVPNERNHPINTKIKSEEWLKQGLITLEFESGANKLYRFK